MTEHTTIQITKTQAQQLQELRQYDDEPYKSVIARLLDSDNSTIDSDEVAQKVIERLEGSKPLAEMEFEDWFEPDYAQTIASHIESEVALGDVNITLDASERAQIARDVAEELR